VPQRDTEAWPGRNGGIGHALDERARKSLTAPCPVHVKAGEMRRVGLQSRPQNRQIDHPPELGSGDWSELRHRKDGNGPIRTVGDQPRKTLQLGTPKLVLRRAFTVYSDVGGGIRLGGATLRLCLPTTD